MHSLFVIKKSSFAKTFVFGCVFLISFVSIIIFGSVFTNATSIDSDFEVQVDEVLELRLLNCDNTNSSVVVVEVTPTTAGTFKSNCQTASIHTNAPGYTLTTRASSSDLLYQNPTTITPTPNIISTTNPIATPAVLTNDTWGFAVENRLNFDTSYTVDSATNIYAELPTQDTTIYTSTGVFPITVTSHKFYYATRLTPATMAGTYMTTVTYTAIGELPVEYPGFWHTDGRDIINPYNDVTLLKAFNISTSTAVWYDDDMPNLDRVLVQHNDFTYAELESLGINAVRFVFSARLIADSCTTDACLDYDNSEDVFELFDEILTHASNHNIGVIFNIHNSYGTSNPRTGGTNKWNTFTPENLAKTTALWEQIATRYKDDKRVLGYDLMNEPMVKLEDSEGINDAITKWDSAAQDMINAIRAIDQNHMIIVEKINHGLKNNGNTSIYPSISNYVFPSVSDPQNNIMYEFHDYGNWEYATQSDERMSIDPWVWPNENFLGEIHGSGFSSYMAEIWPPARFRVDDGDSQDTWVTLESNNGNPLSVSSSYNIGMVSVEVTGNLASDSVIYVDDIVVEEYDTGGNYLRAIFDRTFRISENVTKTANISIELDNTSMCYDNDGGCIKIIGPTTGSIIAAASRSDLQIFRIDNTKRYKVSAKFYGENLPSGVSVRVMLAYSNATDQQARPYNKTYLNEMLQKYVDYSINNDVPIFNGEYGVLRNEVYWDSIGASQFVNDSLEVYEENYINSAYFSYYNRNNSATQRNNGLRVREYNIETTLPVTADNTVLNTKLRDVFLNHL